MRYQCPRCEELGKKQYLSIVPKGSQLELNCLNRGCGWVGSGAERRLRDVPVGQERRQS